MLGPIIANILSITFVVLVFKWDKLYKVRNKIKSLFWEDIFYSEKNRNKPGIKMFKIYIRFVQVLYLYVGIGLLITAVINLDKDFLIAGFLSMILFPLMFRLVIGVQRKLWDIN